MGRLKEVTQFVVNEDGERIAVVVDIDYWEALMGLLEDLEDVRLVRDAMGRLEQGPAIAGAVRWEDARADL